MARAKSRCPARSQPGRFHRFNVSYQWPYGNDASKSVDLTGVDLSNAILHHVNFSGVMLGHSSLHLANLQVANLSGANLSGSNLSGRIHVACEISRRKPPDRRSDAGGAYGCRLNQGSSCIHQFVRCKLIQRHIVRCGNESALTYQVPISPVCGGFFSIAIELQMPALRRTQRIVGPCYGANILVQV